MIRRGNKVSTGQTLEKSKSEMMRMKEGGATATLSRDLGGCGGSNEQVGDDPTNEIYETAEQ